MSDKKLDEGSTFNYLPDHFEIKSKGPLTVQLPRPKERKIVDYVLVSVSDEDYSSNNSKRCSFDDGEWITLKTPDQELELLIQNLSRKGFVPIGGASIAFDSEGYRLVYQAMVKYEEAEDER